MAGEASSHMGGKGGSREIQTTTNECSPENWVRMNSLEIGDWGFCYIGRDGPTFKQNAPNLTRKKR